MKIEIKLTEDTLSLPIFYYNETNKADYALTKKQLSSMSRRDLIKEVKYLINECEGLQSEVCDIHALIHQVVIRK